MGEKTAAEHLADAARHDQTREDSHQRSDTDGFVSQWASGKMSDLSRAKAKIAEEGGTAEFPGLFRRSDGVRVRAKLISYRCSYSGGTKFSWSFRDENDDIDRSVGLIPDSRKSKRAKLYKAGYEVRMERVEAGAAMAGCGTGLSGQAWVEVYRKDDGYPADAEGV